MGYQRPCDAPVAASWDEHRQRNPASEEPGTDYGCARGTELHAPGDGVVADSKDSPSGATGRFLTLDLDDGTRVRWLHLRDFWPARGHRFSRGDVLAHSGTSMNGDEWGTGSHVHVTRWRVHGYIFNPQHDHDFTGTQDFDALVGGMSGGGGTLDPTEGDDMAKPYVQVKDDRGNFALVGPDGVGRILSGAALRGAQKIAKAANGGDLPEVELSGEEWDADTLRVFAGQ